MADRSTFLSVLDWLDRPGQAVLNLARGNPGAAGRHVLDFLADIPDAAIPGHAFPDFAKPEDYAHAADLVGIDRQQSPFLGALADTVGGAATNPLTYVGFGEGQGLRLAGKTVAFAGETMDPLSVAGRYARAGIDALPKLDKYVPDFLQTDKGLGQSAMETANRTVQGTREMLGWLSPDENVADLRARGEARFANVANAKQPVLDAMFKGTDIEDRKRAFRLINNYDWKDGKAFRLGDVGDGRMGTWDEQQQLLQSRIANAPWSDEQKAKALDLASKALQHERGNFQEAVQDFPGMHAVYGEGQGIDTHAPLDYARREFTFDGPDEATAQAGAAAKSMKSRTITTNDELLAALNDGRNAGKNPLNEDLGEMTARRAEFQGKLAKRAMIGQELIDRGMKGELGENVKGAVMNAVDKRQQAGQSISGFGTLSDDTSEGLVNDVIEELKRSSPDDAAYLRASFQGLDPRGRLTGAMAKLNRFFKPAAVYGVGWPGKVAAVNRNILNFPWQILSEESLGAGPAWDALKRTPNTMGYSFGRGTDHVFGSDLTRGFVAENQDLIDKAMQQAGGRLSKAMDFLHESGRDDIAAMLEHGVRGGGFVRSEDLMKGFKDQRFPTKAMNAMGVKPENQNRFWRFMEGGGEAFEGAEDYGRSRTFYDARERNLANGMSEEEANRKAAASVRGALYDYDTTNELQRGLGDFIPFAKYLTQSTRQQANFLSRTPAVGTALAGLYGDDGDKPLYPYLQETAHLPLGKGETGHDQYLTGLGLPIESLNEIPNVTGTASLRGLGREIERVVGGSSQPLAKTAYTYLAGHDPMFNTPAGSYQKLPGNIDAGETGRLYNLAMGTGLFEPIDMVAKQVGKLADDRLGPGDKALDLLMGGHVVDVDPKQALKQQLVNELQTDPNVRPTTDFFIPHDVSDDDASAVLRELHRLQTHPKKHAGHGSL